MEIYLIRHGESTGNGQSRFMGWSDHPLTEPGQRQAAALAARLAPLGPMPIYCSDLLRARQTAAAVAVRWEGAIIVDPRWREVCCGDFEDRPWDDFTANADLQQQFAADPFTACMPGGESVVMMAERVTRAFTELCAPRSIGTARVAVVTHGGPIRAVLAHCLQIPYARYWALDAAHGGITHISLVDGWFSIRVVNDTSHLTEAPHYA